MSPSDLEFMLLIILVRLPTSSPYMLRPISDTTRVKMCSKVVDGLGAPPVIYTPQHHRCETKAVT